MEIPISRDLRPLHSAVGSPSCVASLTRVFHRSTLYGIPFPRPRRMGPRSPSLIPREVSPSRANTRYFALRDDTRCASLSAPSVRGEVCHGFSYRFFATAPWIDRFPLEGMQARIARCPDVATR